MDTIYLHFETTTARANILAEELQTYLQLRYDVYLPRTKAAPAGPAALETQDAGSILTIALAAPSMVAVAQGIRVWLTKRNNIRIHFKNKAGEIIGTGLSGKDLPEFFEGAEKLLKVAAGKHDDQSKTGVYGGA